VTNPYKALPDHCFWSRAVSWAAPGRLDPIVGHHTISTQDKVATMGSCFAQHMAKFIKSIGLNYYVAEDAPHDMDTCEAQRRNFGTFSARYGNVYTARQAVQLFDRAFGRFTPEDGIWQKGGGFVDAFRPQIEPESLASPDAVSASASQHLGYVRDVFTQCDWLVFTLGLTEAWRSKKDGAVYPMAPGVGGNEFDPAIYEFVNFTAEDVRNDLIGLVERLSSVNAKAKIILTVSPVPLIATYEPRHVLVSTTFSKAALRVAADEVERRFENVIYFPSYEIITSPAAGGRYYQDDLRQVSDLGVNHVMQMFATHFIDAETASQAMPSQVPDDTLIQQAGIVCDEEMIERAIKVSGFR
jgi:GSCFA family